MEHRPSDHRGTSGGLSHSQKAGRALCDNHHRSAAGASGGPEALRVITPEQDEDDAPYGRV